MLQIVNHCGGIAQTNCFLIGDEAGGQAVLFDAPNDTAGVLVKEAQRRGWRVEGLWLTHGHFDHIADHAVVTEAFPKAQVLIHKADEPKLQGAWARLFPLPFVIPPRDADGTVEDNQVLRLGHHEVRVLHTPGHCAGHVCYYFPNDKLLVGGDLIIQGSIGRTDLPDSDQRLMVQSLRRIAALPGQTRLLPGHGPATLLSEEFQSNPWLAKALRD